MVAFVIDGGAVQGNITKKFLRNFPKPMQFCQFFFSNFPLIVIKYLKVGIPTINFGHCYNNFSYFVYHSYDDKTIPSKN